MSAFTEVLTHTFHTVSCYSCSCAFAINEDLYRAAVLDKVRSVYCPACGSRTRWPGETEAQKARREAKEEIERMQRRLDTQKRYAENESARADQAQRQLSATKGVVTRIKNRVSKGVCPCCNRTFQDLQQHMASQHPDFAKSE